MAFLLRKNFPISMETRIKMLSEIEGSNIHCYGKSREILGRKMAHITFLLSISLNNLFAILLDDPFLMYLY